MSTAVAEKTRNEELILTPGEGKTVNVFGVDVTILVTAEQTGGAYSTYLIDCAPGAGSPFHLHHRDDESFHVLEGEFAFVVGERWVTAGPGTTVFLPRGISHMFINQTGQRARMLGCGSPAGHERFFEDAARLAEKGVPPSPEEAAAVCARYDMDLLPPPSAAR